MVRLQPAVGVPRARAAGAVLHLDEPHAALDEPPRGEQLHAEVLASRSGRGRTARCVSAVSSAKLSTSGTDVCMRKASSYALNPRRQRRIVGILDAAQPVQLVDQVEADLAARRPCSGSSGWP